MISVTAGKSFTDIDAFACALAYVELLRLEGRAAEAVLPGPVNHSVTDMVKSWGMEFRTTPSVPDASFVLVDLSEIEFCADFTRAESVVEVYDHHFGTEKEWAARIGAASHIEKVGACATLIWEEFKKRGHADKISEVSARVLLAAIVSNTLNFGAFVTDQRDIAAAAELELLAHLPASWIAEYFSGQETGVLADPIAAVVGDTKTLKIAHPPFLITIGQMELWDGVDFISAHTTGIRKALEGFGSPHWIMSVPSISEKKNHLYVEDPILKKLLTDLVGAQFEGDMGVTERLWLRKEIRNALS